MIRWRTRDQITPGFGPSVVTIGNFDGVHRGHQHVIGRLLDAARERHARSVVVTFDPHPALVHRPESHPGVIMGLDDKLDALETIGADAALVLPYSLEFSRLSPEEFVVDYLVRPLGAVCLVIGEDVRLGRDNTGDLHTIRALGRAHGFDVVVVEEIMGGQRAPGHDHPAPAASAERRCSSTWIRSCLDAGDVRRAAELLSRNHRMRGEVVHGAARGRQLGYPTANLSPDATGFTPADGVYAGWLVDEKAQRWPAAISVGSNPTFDGVQRQVEAHVIDRPAGEHVTDFDLYGHHVVVEFVERLRGMVAYRGVEALVEQMDEDVKRSRAILSRESRGTV